MRDIVQKMIKVSSIERRVSRGWRALTFLPWVGGFCSIVVSASISVAEGSTQEQATMMVVVGAAGEEEFGKAFSEWAGLWEKAATTAGAKTIGIGLKSPEAATDREKLEQALAAEAKESGELWLVLIGHGTFD